MSKICVIGSNFNTFLLQPRVNSKCYDPVLRLAEAGHCLTLLFNGRGEGRCAEDLAKNYIRRFGWIYADLREWADKNLPECERLGNYPPVDQLLDSRMLLEYLKRNIFDVVYFLNDIGQGLFPLQYKQAGLGFEDTVFCVMVHSVQQQSIDGMSLSQEFLMEFVAQRIELEAMRMADALVATSCEMADLAAEFIGRGRKDFVVAPSNFDKSSILVDTADTETVGHENQQLMFSPDAILLRWTLEHILVRQNFIVSNNQGLDSTRSEHLQIKHLERMMDSRSLLSPKSWPSDDAVPVVSVIVPHFNSPKYLEQALTTLLEQDFDENYEIIVVDDHSTQEGIWSRLEHMTARLADSRVHLTRMTANQGPAASRNHGVTLARGRYLVFFDADNEALPHMLTYMVRAIRASGLDCMTCFNRLIKQNDRDNPKPLDLSNAAVCYTPIGPVMELGVFLNVYGDSCSIMHRDVPSKVGGWPEDHNSREDWEFFTKVCVHGFGFGVIPEVLYLYRDDNGSRRNQKTETQNYVGLGRIIDHLASPSGRQRIRLKDLLLFAAGMTISGYSISHSGLSSVYNCFAKLSPETLATYLRFNSSTATDTESSQGKTLHHVQEILWPLVCSWESSGEVRRVMLFGAGEHSKVVLGMIPVLGRYLKGFIDSNFRGEFIGLPCIGPKEVSAENIDVIIYSSAVHELAMYARLRHLPVEHVLLYHDLPVGNKQASDITGDCLTAMPRI